jgi:hypothetical protein
MDGQDALVIFLLFFVRLLVPLIVLLALGYLYERWSARRPARRPRSEPETAGRTNWPSAGTRNYSPCWESKNCSPEQRALCPAARRAGVPCWLTMQLVEGRLPERCLDCQVFKDSSALPLASD